MSTATRLARADKQILRPPAGCDIARNSAGVPGGISTAPLPHPISVAGQRWEPADAQPWATPIGYRLAVELRPAVDLVKANRP